MIQERQRHHIVYPPIASPEKLYECIVWCLQYYPVLSGRRRNNNCFYGVVFRAKLVLLLRLSNTLQSVIGGNRVGR
jgi:hypothetical protein